MPNHYRQRRDTSSRCFAVRRFVPLRIGSISLSGLVSVWLLLGFDVAYGQAVVSPEQSARLARLPRIEGLRIPSGPAAAAHLDGIVLQQLDGTDPEGEILFEAQRGDTTRLQIEVGAPLAWRIVLFPPDPAMRLRVEQQFETSMAIGDEGPHLDLLRWKHHVSEWTPLAAVAPLQFASEEARSDSFPVVTREELEAAVRAEAQVGDPEGERAAVERWGSLAQTCASPTTAPCYVAVSLVRWRVVLELPAVATGEQVASPAVATGEQVASPAAATPAQRVIQVLELLIPLGC